MKGLVAKAIEKILIEPFPEVRRLMKKHEGTGRVIVRSWDRASIFLQAFGIRGRILL